MSYPSNLNEAHYSQRGATVPVGMAENKYIRVLSAMSSQLLLWKISDASHLPVVGAHCVA